MLLPVEHAREALARAAAVAVLTGAGVSAESGVPTFRSNGGYWNNFQVEDLATPQGFARNPKLVWEWYEARRRDLTKAHPNAGHYALTELERRTPEFTLITQNVDGLHTAAGSQNIIHLHGDIWITRCTRCGNSRVDREPLADLPPLCDCGALMRPGVVWFGEQLPEGSIERATIAVQQADVFIVAGTSAQVYPAAGLIPLAVQQGAKVIEINPEETEFSADVTWSLRGPSALILAQLL
jgi:NAD-dependent deacetylase